MIELVNISAGYGKSPVVQNISVKAGAGEFIGVVGPNGSGKSTLLKSMAGLLPLQTGEVLWDDKPLAAVDTKERARTIAYLDQARDTQSTLSVRRVVELGRAPYRGELGRLSPEGKMAVDTALEKTRSDRIASRKFNQLSGGEQSRVLLARALSVTAKGLIADEPLTGLDPEYQFLILDCLKNESRRGQLVVTSIQDLRLARQYFDRLWIMNTGSLVADGTPQQVLKSDILKDVFRVETTTSDLWSYQAVPRE